MRLATKRCRCCGLQAFERCGPRLIMPFFAKYGLHLSITARPNAPSAPGALNSFSFFNQIEYGACSQCNLIAPWPTISDDTLLDFYSFYLSESYKVERGNHEAWYRSISASHGSDAELEIRRQDNERYIEERVKAHIGPIHEGQASMLDYGGGSGKVSPRFSWLSVDIYDVGDHLIRPRLDENSDKTRTKLDALGRYDVIQALHVLEHVGDPRAIVTDACSMLKEGGIIFIEVPWEMQDFDTMKRGLNHICDEHINKFCDKSIRLMMEGLGLEVILCESGYVNNIHITDPARVVRCLARKGASRRPSNDS